MTSKEALNRLFATAVLCEPENCGQHVGLKHIIENDLALLEILRKHVSIFNTLPQCQYPDLIILQGSEINIDEARIIND